MMPRDSNVSYEVTDRELSDTNVHDASPLQTSGEKRRHKFKLEPKETFSVRAGGHSHQTSFSKPGSESKQPYEKVNLQA